MRIVLYLSFSVLFLSACNNRSQQVENAGRADTLRLYTQPQRSDFTDTLQGKAIDLFFLKNGACTAAITNYGGRLVSLFVPDMNGNPVDVIVGPDRIQDFLTSSEPFFGASIGRYGNRIAKGSLSIDGKTFQLDVNNGVNTLHGGKNGFHQQVWSGQQVNDSTLELRYLSADGEQGFPGNLSVKITYTLKQASTLQIDYEASTDKKTVCNLTNHAFFNLNGVGSGSIYEHEVQIDADHYTPVDVGLIPLGKNESVAQTPFDFRTSTRIGQHVDDTTNLQIRMGLGYDHNFVLNKKAIGTLEWAARVKGDQTGITMDVYTEEPGLQFYSGNFMKSKNRIKGEGKDDYRTAFCLETQHFPDSPHQPLFPTTLLLPNTMYHTSSIYKFSTSH
ncbi:MAG: galactose mutarotase [Bacteroidetes bacterium]|nr:galactose mutarotase [Bacteroidota bacterium]